MNQNQTNNPPKSSRTVRAGHLSEMIAGLGFLLGDVMDKRYKHGLSYHPLYQIWIGMKKKML